MTQGAVEVLSGRPSDMSPWAFIRFGADYSAEHPVWMLGGLADLDSMRLPATLEARLHRWADYWDRNHDFETGWPAGLPARWWQDEQHELPCDLALTIGSEAVIISVEGRLLRSRGAGTSHEAAEAMRTFIIAGEAEDRAFAEAQSRGGTTVADIVLTFRPESHDGDSDGLQLYAALSRCPAHGALPWSRVRSRAPATHGRTLLRPLRDDVADFLDAVRAGRLSPWRG